MRCWGVGESKALTTGTSSVCWGRDLLSLSRPRPLPRPFQFFSFKTLWVCLWPGCHQQGGYVILILGIKMYTCMCMCNEYMRNDKGLYNFLAQFLPNICASRTVDADQICKDTSKLDFREGLIWRWPRPTVTSSSFLFLWKERRLFLF